MNNRSRPTSSSLPLILIGIGVLVIIGVVAWVASRGAAANNAAAPTLALGAVTPENQIQRVSLTDAKNALDNKSAVFVDVRDAESYDTGHVPGALNIPLANIEAGNGINQLDPNQWIITYCT